jgi:WD40 repeat protein
MIVKMPRKRGGVFVGPMPKGPVMENPDYERLDELAVESRKTEQTGREINDDILDTVNVRDPCTYVTYRRSVASSAMSLLTNNSVRNVLHGDQLDPHSREPLHSDVLEYATRVPVRSYSLPEGSSITCITFSKSDKYIIGGTKNGKVFVWNTNSGVKLEVVGPNPNPQGVIKVWSEYAEHVFFVGRQYGAVEKWRISQDGTTIRFISSLNLNAYATMHALDFSTDQMYFVGRHATNDTGSVCFANTRKDEIRSIKAKAIKIKDIKLAQYFNKEVGMYRVASVDSDGNVKVWNPFTRRSWEILARKTKVCAICISPNADRFAIGTARGSVHVLNAENGEVIFKLRHPTCRRMVSLLAWSNDGGYIYAAGKHGSIHIWNVSNGTLDTTFELAPSSYPIYMTLAHNINALAVVCNHGFVHKIT